MRPPPACPLCHAAWRGAQIDIEGAAISHPWTLLTKDVFAGESSICVSDDVSDWPVGATLALSPTDTTYNIWSQVQLFSIFNIGQIFVFLALIFFV